MTTRIQRSFSFQAGAYCETFLMNVYDFTLFIEVNTDSSYEQNVAMDRLVYFATECLEGCVFIRDSEKKMIDKYTNVGFRVCTLPEEPYDQIIMLMLLAKLNAIVEGRLSITDITIESKLSDGVVFLHDIDSSFGPLDSLGWWHDSGKSIAPASVKKDKIVNLFKTSSNGWNDVGLSWKEREATETSPEIAFSPEPVK